MKNCSFRFLVPAAFLAGLLPALAAAQPINSGDKKAVATGSRLGPSSAPSQVVEFNTPDEVRLIRKMIDERRYDDALRRALEYISEVEESSISERSQSRYYAYNALCGVHTVRGELDEAEGACNTAIEIYPAKWSALNNRGTVYLMARSYQEAIADYERALPLAPNKMVEETLHHNIEIARQRLAGE